jgi:hypothetical protein
LLKRFFKKRAPVFAPGLFCVIAIFAAPLWGENASFSLSGGSLLVTPEGTSGYRLGGLSYIREDGLRIKANVGEIFLHLPEVQGDISVAAGQFGFEIPNFAVTFSAGFFRHSSFKADFGETVFNSEGGAGVLFNTVLSFRVLGVTLEPSAAYAEASWRNGDFYWFFGKPNIPSFWRFGLTGTYDTHSLGFKYLSFNADILSNDNMLLFTSTSGGFALYYRFSGNWRNMPLGGIAGYFYAAANMEGTLSSFNQHYFLFPYLFYNVDASFTAHIGFAAIRLSRDFSIFRIKAALGAAQVFRGQGSADIHYQEKNLFGGKEKFDASPVNLGGPGAAFLSVDFGVPSLRIGPHARLSLGFKKTLAIPWGYKGLLPADKGGPQDSGSGGGVDTGLLKTLLLSGFSFYGSLGVH